MFICANTILVVTPGLGQLPLNLLRCVGLRRSGCKQEAQIQQLLDTVLLVERENESFLFPLFLPNEWAEKLGELPTSLKEETSQMLVSTPASPLLVL